MTGFETRVFNVCGTIYLLHFDRPFGHACHYTGITSNLDARLAAHAAGRGARLLAAVADAGIGWTLAGTWAGDRHAERAFKRQGGACRRCPVCLRAALAGVASGLVVYRRLGQGLTWIGGPTPAGVPAALRRASQAGLLTTVPRACHPAAGLCGCPSVQVWLSAAGHGQLRALELAHDDTERTAA